MCQGFGHTFLPSCCTLLSTLPPACHHEEPGSQVLANGVQHAAILHHWRQSLTLNLSTRTLFSTRSFSAELSFQSMPGLCLCLRLVCLRAGLLQFHEAAVNPFFQPAETHRSGSLTLQLIYNAPQFHVICKHVGEWHLPCLFLPHQPNAEGSRMKRSNILSGWDIAT